MVPVAEPKLTFPATDVGSADIMYGPTIVGHVLGTFHAWEAILWPVANRRPNPQNCEVVERPLLRDLRADLRRRLAEDGPWWSEPEVPS